MASVPSGVELEGPPTQFSRAWWRELLRSRFTLGGAYGLAIALTATAVFLASSPPSTGPIGPATTVILVVLGFNLALILSSPGIVGWRLLDLVDAGASDAGARLHLRFVGLFSVAAVAPAVVVALFFGVLVNRGVDAWFSQTACATVVENSATVARSYVTEQTSYITQHVGPMAGTLNQAAPTLADSPVAFGHFLKSLAADNGFSVAYVLDRDGRVLARAERPTRPALPWPRRRPASCGPPSGDITSEQLRRRRPVPGALSPSGLPDAYLYMAEPVDEGILAHLIESADPLISYREAAKNPTRIQVIFGLSYIETALLVLVAAVWVGIAAANSIAAPGLGPGAGGRPGVGRRPGRPRRRRDRPEEIRALSVAFNMMTHRPAGPAGGPAGGQPGRRVSAASSSRPCCRASAPAWSAWTPRAGSPR